MDASLWIILLAGAGALIVARLYFKVRSASKQREAGWDAKMVERLRAQGFAPFKEYTVDFFLALPDEGAVQAVRVQLEALGYAINVKPMENDAELHFSLDATKVMRLIVPEMEEASRGMTALAGQFRGRYDGWAV